MSADTSDNRAYSEAVASGKYQRDDSLRGKYDHVRIHWEDESTRIFLEPHLRTSLAAVREKGRGLRILDLGCGSGDGYEMLLSVRDGRAPLHAADTHMLHEQELDLYLGVEINRDLLAQNTERWGDRPAMRCCWGDFSQGLPPEARETAFDIYFTSYGSLSHLHEVETVRLFSDIAQHAENGAMLVGDWLGRYSYEWQTLWNSDTSSEQWMDYYISYIYPPDQREQARLTPLKLRLLARAEVDRIITRVMEETGIRLEIRKLFDRSLTIGRHMDTGDYNTHCVPLREQVNALFERNRRTDLTRFEMPYHEQGAMADHDQRLAGLFTAWNALVRHTRKLCDEPVEHLPCPALPCVGNACARLSELKQQRDLLDMDDFRANVLEPQLAYHLRNLEMQLQQGQANGHGLVGIFNVLKP